MDALVVPLHGIFHNWDALSHQTGYGSASSNSSDGIGVLVMVQMTGHLFGGSCHCSVDGGVVAYKKKIAMNLRWKMSWI